MKRSDITIGMHVLIRQRPGSTRCDEYEVVDYCGDGRWLVRMGDNGPISERDGRSFRKMD